MGNFGDLRLHHQELTSQARVCCPIMEAAMALGKDLWDCADDFSRMCGVQSATAARFYALGRMLAERRSPRSRAATRTPRKGSESFRRTAKSSL